MAKLLAEVFGEPGMSELLAQPEAAAVQPAPASTFRTIEPSIATPEMQGITSDTA